MFESGGIWEVIQIITGEILIYRKGFKEEALIKDVFKFDPENKENQFSRFGKCLLKPADSGTLRLNRALIVAAWYLDSDSEAVRELKRIFPDLVSADAGKKE